MCLCDIPHPKMRASTPAFTGLWSVMGCSISPYLWNAQIYFHFIYYRVLLKLPDIFMNIVNNYLNFREKQIGRGNIGGSGGLQKTSIYLCLM